MTDATAHLMRGLQALADRKPRPRPFVDVASLPWDQTDFSRHFLRTATRGARYTQREITFLQQCGVLAPARRILDLACGGGRHSLAMARLGARRHRVGHRSFRYCLGAPPRGARWLASGVCGRRCAPACVRGRI